MNLNKRLIFFLVGQPGLEAIIGVILHGRVSMTYLIQSTVPVLASLDIDETIDFYTRRLGFIEALRMDDYAIISRDGAEIHFWLCSDRHIAENTSCYVRVADTDKMFQDFTASGLVLRPPAVRPWGMKELYVIDTHGNLLKFGERA